MSAEHGSHEIERHCDAAIVDGSAAGLAAALELVRAGRSVIVVDPGEPQGGTTVDRNRDVHREELRRHGGEVLAGRASAVTSLGDGHVRVDLVGGHSIVARRALAATRPADGELPDGLVRLVAEGGGEPSAADGSRVGARLELELAEDDRRNPDRTSAQQADWDRRYGDDPIWSGNPNGTLVHEVAGLTPGRALDVGAGEGGDAIWLAEQGWAVTANDISPRALRRVEAEATRRGLRVTCLHADANDDAFPASAFDLVSLQYASIPRTPDDRAVRNVLRAVAPGGTLLVVSHDLDPMRAPVDTTTHSRAFDPDAYLRVEDFVVALTDRGDWDVAVHEKRPRPPGAASSHHVDDLVLRARRRA